MDFIEENGDRDNHIIVKTDQEPSIEYLIKDLIEHRIGGKTVPEESPVRSSGSNGIVERGVQEIENQIRALFLGFQERLKRKVDARERIVGFIPEYAAYLVNRLNVGKDGKVAYERIKGKKPTILGLEFGEKILYKMRKGQKMEKINARWEFGIFVGIKRKSNELWIATKEGIISVRSARRIPVEKRWSEDCVAWVKWAPWNRYKDARDADGDVPEGVPVEEKIEEGNGNKVVFVETRHKVPRDFYIKKEDAEKHGYTQGCGGCSSWFTGLARQPHTEKCRDRFRDLMKEGAKVKNQETRKREFEEKESERKRRKEEKRDKKEKRKAEDEGEDERLEGSAQVGGGSSSGQVREEDRHEDMDIAQVEELVDLWINEVQAVGFKDEGDILEVEGPCDSDVEEEICKAWDDVHGGDLPMKDVQRSRKEEVDYMVKRDIWGLVSTAECWDKTGKAPVSTRWVDTNKAWEEDGMEVRCRLVARDFKGGDKDRDDLFAETPPLEAKRLLLSRAATRRKDGRMRKAMFIHAKKAHLNPKCDQDVYIQLPSEVGCPEGMCGKLNYWLYGFRPAAAAWEKLYAEKFESVGFKRGESCGVVFYHEERDILVVVHGDDFTFCALEEDLFWIRDQMAEWFEIKVRGILGDGLEDVKQIVILGRLVKWTPEGIEYEADPKHRRFILDYFGFDSGSRILSCNGDKEDQVEDWEDELLQKEEATQYRGLAARFNFLSLDSPDLQFVCKPACRDMARPTRGSWKKLKKCARYLLCRDRIVWQFGWQDEARYSHLSTDSDWGGIARDRKSTSGGLWMIGNHCIKTWSATQGPYALSSAEAEFYAMIEGVTRAKGLLSLVSEMGFGGLSNVIHLGTDSSAAKSFVSRRGLGRMRHIEIRDLWLQKEVREGKIEVSKIRGDSNPADLMTKVLGIKDIIQRLGGMNIRMEVAEGFKKGEQALRDLFVTSTA